MQIKRLYTTVGHDPYALFTWEKRTSEIRNPNGSTVFRMDDVEVPAGWSQTATDVLSQKYFRRAGVPLATTKIAEPGVPEWLCRSTGITFPGTDVIKTASETSAKQVFDRLAGCWTYWGWKEGYFKVENDEKAIHTAAKKRVLSEANARAFYDEMRFMLAAQMAAPNSPQWFNTGLH